MVFDVSLLCKYLFSVIYFLFLTEPIHIFMMRMMQDVLQTKIDFFDPHMRGEWIKSSEEAHVKSKKMLYSEEEKMEISEEAQVFFLASDDDLEILKTKAAKYGRDLKAVPIDGDCYMLYMTKHT